MEIVILALLALCPILMIVAGLHDLTTMKIPNWISLALIAAFFPAALVVGLPPVAVAVHVGVALAALFVGAGMFALGWVGGGDAKLLAAGCLWLGWSALAPFLIWTGLVGGVFCLTLLMGRLYYPALGVRSAPGWVMQLMQPKGDIPYGVAIAAGALMAFTESGLWTAFLSAR